MSAAPLRLTLYDGLPGTAGLSLPGGGVWFVYAPQGGIAVGEGDAATRLAADDGAFASPGARLTGQGPAWLYQVTDAGEPFAPQLRLLRSQRLSPGFGPPYVVRADRIESEAGAATPRHGHRGPGIRRLIFGAILAEVGEAVDRIDAGASWFESGREMVVGTNIGGGNAAFVRVMVLPAELEGGKSSFMAADAIEAAKPRSVQARLFSEMVWPGPAPADR